MERWRDRIIAAFHTLGGQASYKDLYNSLAAQIGRTLTDGEMAGVRREIENHSSDSRNWKSTRPDIFCSIQGLGSGRWGLRSYENNDRNDTYLEGDRIYKELSTLKRCRTLVDKAKSHYGFTCMVCQFNFEKTYGPLGKGFAECHHLDPLLGRDGVGTPTTIAELAIVCANCHRMLHRRNPALTLAELRTEIENSN